MESCSLHSIGQTLVILCSVSCVLSAPATFEVKLLSQTSGRFVYVMENATIHANEKLKYATVFNMYLKNSQIQFEMKSKPGMFLMLKEVEATSATVNVTETNSYSRPYALGMHNSTDANLTRWNRSGDCGILSQSVENLTACSIAFNKDGDVIGPCHVVTEDCIAIVLA